MLYNVVETGTLGRGFENYIRVFSRRRRHHNQRSEWCNHFGCLSLSRNHTTLSSPSRHHKRCSINHSGGRSNSNRPNSSTTPHITSSAPRETYNGKLARSIYDFIIGKICYTPRLDKPRARARWVLDFNIGALACPGSAARAINLINCNDSIKRCVWPWGERF